MLPTRDYYYAVNRRLGTSRLLCTCFLALIPACFLFGQLKTTQQAVHTAIRIEAERQQAVGVAVGVLLDGQIAFYCNTGYEDRDGQIPI